MKINAFKFASLLAIAGIISIPAITLAQEAFVPVTDTGATGGVDNTFVPVTDAGSTGGADASSAVFVPTTDAGSVGGADSSVTVPVTDGANTGGADIGESHTSNGNSNPTVGSSSGGSTGGGYSSVSVSAPKSLNLGNCSYLNDFLKFDSENNTAQVTKLQTFLKDIEKMDVDVNGKFDQKTLDAVKAFQEKYVNDVMRPWGVNSPTGEVFLTTKKKINEIYCKSVFSLTSEEMAKIQEYKNNLANIVNNTSTSTDLNATGTMSIIPSVSSTTDNDQSAAVVNTSFTGKVWNFIKWLFGY